LGYGEPEMVLLPSQVAAPQLQKCHGRRPEKIAHPTPTHRSGPFRNQNLGPGLGDPPRASETANSQLVFNPDIRLRLSASPGAASARNARLGFHMDHRQRPIEFE